MKNALIWKEYRELRRTFAGLTVLLVALSVICGWIADERVDRVCAWAIVAMLALYAVMLGGNAVASERQRGTWDYLCALPMEKRTLWQIKFGCGITALLLLSAVGIGILIRLAGVAAPLMSALVFYGVVSVIFLFCCAFAFSTVLPGGLTAAACGLTIYLGIVTMCFPSRSWQDGNSLRLWLLSGVLLLGAIVQAVVSRRTIVRSSMDR